ncbi:MAG: carboxylesterase family protein [Acidobacteriota bacterium]
MSGSSAESSDSNRVKTENGLVEGITLPSGIHAFRGIPYAAPPVRELRWQPPQPVEDWEGVRPADRFAPQCMQQRVFNDMMFRNSGVSEDCLYLNVWTPSPSSTKQLPVLVYYYGGGFIAGDGSEYRYDGESLAQRGIVVVTMSYRLGIFGFFAHPELTAESPHHSSGNYTFMDQTAVLEWVQKNIGAFGGDPGKVTIAGESAGSVSVSALMATPLTEGLFAGAIGESGSVLGTLPPVPLSQGEAAGAKFAAGIGAPSLDQLRAISAMALLQAASQPGVPRFSSTVDGYFYPKSPAEIYAKGEQAHVPLLVGWNSEEMSDQFLLRGNEPTPEDFAKAVRNLYDGDADAVLKAYPAATREQTIQSATALASDRFIAFSTWRWFDLQRQTGDAPVYRYFYAHPRPPMKPQAAEGAESMGRGGRQAGPPPAPSGAVHSAEIEYALGNLATNPVYAWTQDDYKVSETMEGFFANFIKTGNPNGPDLPEWPAAGSSAEKTPMIMRIDVQSKAEPAPHRDRYLLLEKLAKGE